MLSCVASGQSNSGHYVGHGSGATDSPPQPQLRRCSRRLTVKKPGPEPEPAESSTRLNLENVAEGAITLYTSLIYDVLTGCRSLFTSSAGLAAAFRAFQPLLDNRPALEIYPDDSWGPAAADSSPTDLAGGWAETQDLHAGLVMTTDHDPTRNQGLSVRAAGEPPIAALMWPRRRPAAPQRP
jgi:hypothetical protein